MLSRYQYRFFASIPPFLVLGYFIAKMYPQTTCPSLILWNLECAMCGGIRSYIAFHNLSWFTALTFNPFLFFTLLSAWFLGVLGYISPYSVKVNRDLKRLCDIFLSRPLSFTFIYMCLLIFQGIFRFLN
jgi:hypothetical protein